MSRSKPVTKDIERPKQSLPQDFSATGKADTQARESPTLTYHAGCRASRRCQRFFFGEAESPSL
jgi:hypothetical protein